MDLNQLLKHHQLALIGVAGMPMTPETMGAFDLVGHYARRIKKMRSAMGVAQYPRWIAEARAVGHNR